MISPNYVCKVHKDNQSYILMATLHKLTPQTKHIALKYHQFCKHVKSGHISYHIVGFPRKNLKCLPSLSAMISSLNSDKPRGALPRRHLCTFRILIPYYFIPYIMPLCYSAIPPFHHITPPCGILLRLSADTLFPAI